MEAKNKRITIPIPIKCDWSNVYSFASAYDSGDLCFIRLIDCLIFNKSCSNGAVFIDHKHNRKIMFKFFTQLFDFQQIFFKWSNSHF